MTRSSRHRSHKERKHSSKEARDYSDSEEDVRIKERESREDDVSVRVFREFLSGEKRKKDGKYSTGNGNGDVGEEFVSSKRRKDKMEGSSGGDRWNGGGEERADSVAVDKEVKGGSSRVDSDKVSKSKESKFSGDSKSKSSKKVDGSVDKKENSSVLMEKEESRSAGKVESRRKSDKDSTRRESSKDTKELKDKERGFDRERKVQDAKRDAETRAADGEVTRKQRSDSVDLGDDSQGKGGRENTGKVTCYYSSRC